VKFTTENQQFPNVESRAIFRFAEMAGDGEGRANLNGHETGNGGYSQGDAYGNLPFLGPMIPFESQKNVTNLY
jgi:hypothetical protein